MAHTPGPWHVGMTPGPIVYGPKGEQIADLRADLLPKDENVANAILIANVPHLLHQLQVCTEYIRAQWHNENDLPTLCWDTMALLTSALGKQD